MKINFDLKRAALFSLILFLAVLLSFYFSHAEKVWLIISCFLILSLSQVMLIRESILFFMLIGCAVSIGTFFQPQFNQSLWYDRLYDITLGSFLGILGNFFIFPFKIDQEFRRKIIPILESYSNFLLILPAAFSRKKDLIDSVRVVEQLLQAPFFPGWIYAEGFAFSFRQGHRNFLIMVERLGQILITIQTEINDVQQLPQIKSLKEPLKNYCDGAQKILTTICQLINLQKGTLGLSDLQPELAEIEKVAKIIVPQSLSLIDLQTSELALAAFIINLRDFRFALLKLVQALR